MTNKEDRNLYSPANEQIPVFSGAKPARTLAPSLMYQRFFFAGGKPDGEQWQAMMAFFKLNPQLRIKPGTPHPTEDGKWFISYHRDYVGGERWGSKGQLATRRKAALKAQRAYRQRRMQTDAAYREKRLEALREFDEKRSRIAADLREAAGEPKRRRAAKSRRKKK